MLLEHTEIMNSLAKEGLISVESRRKTHAQGLRDASDVLTLIPQDCSKEWVDAIVSFANHVDEFGTRGFIVVSVVQRRIHLCFVQLEKKKTWFGLSKKFNYDIVEWKFRFLQ